MKDNFDLYSERVMQYFINPKNMGKIKDADSIATVGNPKCGDVMKVFLKIGRRPIKVNSKQQTANSKKKTEEYIKDVKVLTLGCGAAIATSSVATEMVKGKSLDEALEVKNSDIVKALGGLPKAKYHCSLLAEQGIKKAVDKYKKKND